MKLIALILLGLMASTASAETSVAKAIEAAKQAEKVRENPGLVLDQRLIDALEQVEIPEEAMTMAKEIGDKTRDDLNEKLKTFSFMGAQVAPEDAKGDGPLDQNQNENSLLDPEKPSRVAYISLSMPDDVLKQVFAAMKGVDRSVAVIRGLVEKDHNIGQSMYALRARLDSLGIDDRPSVYMDFNLFDKLDVQSVPVFAIFDGEEPVASVEGLPNFEWLQKQIDEGMTGSVGRYGTLYEIREEHFMDTIKRRLKNIDFQSQKEQAVSQYWHRRGREYSHLTQADETQSYLVDMSIMVDKDIVGPGNHVVARKGEKFNPLEELNFNRYGIIFNGADEKQVQWAIKQEKLAIESNMVPVPIFTDFPMGGDPWKNLESLQKRFQTNLGQLTRPIRDRFQIQAVPATFQASGGMMKVTEVSLD